MRMTATMPASSTARTTSAARSWAIWFVISAYRNSRRVFRRGSRTGLETRRLRFLAVTAGKPSGWLPLVSPDPSPDPEPATRGPRTRGPADPRTIIALLHGYGAGRPIRQRTGQRRQHRPGRELRSHADRERCAAARRSAAGRARAGRAHRREPPDRPRRAPALAAMGVVQSRHGSGTYIPDGPPALGSEPLSFLAALHGFTREEMYEARRILEVGAAGLAAERATAEQVDARRGSRGACSRRWPIRTASSCTTSTSIARGRGVGQSDRRVARRDGVGALLRAAAATWPRAPASATCATRREMHRRIYQTPSASAHAENARRADERAPDPGEPVSGAGARAAALRRPSPPRQRRGVPRRAARRVVADDQTVRSLRPPCRRRRRHQRHRPRARARAGRRRRRRRRHRPARGDRRRGRRRNRGARAGAPCALPADVAETSVARARARRLPRGRSGGSTSWSTRPGTTKRVPTLEMSEADWQRIMDTNLTGMFRSCQVFGGEMVAARLGPDHRHRLAVVVRRAARGRGVHREQVGGRRTDAGARRRMGAARRHRQRDRARACSGPT